MGAFLNSNGPLPNRGGKAASALSYCTLSTLGVSGNPGAIQSEHEVQHQKHSARYSIGKIIDRVFPTSSKLLDVEYKSNPEQHDKCY